MPFYNILPDPTRGPTERYAIAAGRIHGRFMDFVTRAQRRFRWATRDARRHGYEYRSERQYDLRRQLARDQLRRHRELEMTVGRRRMPNRPYYSEQQLARMERDAAPTHFERYYYDRES